MADSDSSNKRIAKNTVFLYLRTALGILINMFAIRIVWRALGVEDYGIFTLVGGIVLMFQFLNSAMVASSQRFISFELGRGGENLRQVFSISVTVHYMLAGLILLLAETVGIWFLTVKLKIPPERATAAMWVYQCSIVTFMLTVISVPYNAMLIAYEHMKAYGYIGIIEVLLKLAVVLVLLVIPTDKLIAYALMLVAAQVTVRCIYMWYCHRHFEAARYRPEKNVPLIRDMFSFAGWSFLGNMGFSFRDQGLNIILNMFFNVTLNAAKGMAYNVASVISNFSANFQMALNPQITKLYAKGELPRMMLLVRRGCKFSFLLLMLIVVPLFFQAEFVMTLWLGHVDSYVIGFLRLALMVILVESVVSPITTAFQATGRIRTFQIVISIIMLSNLPAAWIWLRFDHNPYVIMWVTLITSTIGIFARLWMLRKHISFSLRDFIWQTFCPLLPPLALSAGAMWWLSTVFPSGLGWVILYCLISCAVIGATGWCFALSGAERNGLKNALLQKFKHRHP